MKALIVVEHFCQGGMEAEDREHLSIALWRCISSLVEHLSDKQCIFSLRYPDAREANGAHSSQLDIVVCSTPEHCLDHRLTDVVSKETFNCKNRLELLAECKRYIHRHHAEYDLVGIFADNVECHDPLAFTKTLSFNRIFGDNAVLLPSLYTMASDGRRAYPAQSSRENELRAVFIGDHRIAFQRAEPDLNGVMLNTEQARGICDPSEHLSFYRPSRESHFFELEYHDLKCRNVAAENRFQL